nr:hypothetical protein [Tanacetum cinerariifolium]
MTSRQISSGLDLTYASSIITTQKPIEHELDSLFKAMYDDYNGGQSLVATRTALAAQAPQVLQTPTGTTTTTNIAPTPTNSSSQATNIPNTSSDVDELKTQQQHDGDMCMYALTVSTLEPSNVKEAMKDPTWIKSMQEELLPFKSLDDSGFELTGFSDAGYAGCKDIFKSTSGGAQFLGHLDVDTVYGLWLSLQQDSNLL